jgi:hypothetical protein
MNKSSKKDSVFWTVLNSQIHESEKVNSIYFETSNFVRIFHFCVAYSEILLSGGVHIWLHLNFFLDSFENFKILNSNFVTRNKSHVSGYTWSFHVELDNIFVDDH